MEWVGWERRRVGMVGAWGRKERSEMGGKLVDLERVVSLSFETRRFRFAFRSCAR